MSALLNLIIYIIAVAWFFALPVFIFIRAVILGDSRFKFFRSLAIMIPWFSVNAVGAFWFVMDFFPGKMGGVNFGIFGAFLTPFLIAFFLAPQALLVVGCLSETMGNMFCSLASQKMDIPATCEKALAAEKRKEFDKAEALYREALESKAKRRLLAPLCLEYGNFLQRRGRMPEAATQWCAALEGKLDVEQYAVTAIRVADALLADGRGKEAVEILGKYMDKYSKSEADSIRMRMRAIEAKLGG